jgi:anti-sigma B factor antagonist
VLEIEAEGSGTAVVALRGELDMHHAPYFREVVTALLNRGDITSIDLDLTAVEVLDATGAGTLIVAHRIAVNLRVALRIGAISAAATQVLILVGAADLLPKERPNGTARPQADNLQPQADNPRWTAETPVSPRTASGRPAFLATTGTEDGI